MKKIGFVGGLTYVSTLDYYRLMNEMINERLGGSEAAEIILYSVNFGEIRKCTESGQWDKIREIISSAAKKIEAAGADCVLIGANTMHKIADEVQQSVNIPLIHIAEETAKAIAAQQLNKIALLGTKYTMQMDFYREKLALFNIETIIPSAKDIDIINYAIYNEMSKGIFTPQTKAEFLRVIRDLQQQGAQGAILGCTEIPLLIKQEDCEIPVFDTLKIHVQAAVDFVLAD